MDGASLLVNITPPHLEEHRELFIFLLRHHDQLISQTHSLTLFSRDLKQAKAIYGTK